MDFKEGVMRANNNVETTETGKYPALLHKESYSTYMTQLLQDSLNQKGPEIKTRYS